MPNDIDWAQYLTKESLDEAVIKTTMERIRLNTKQLINTLTGKNKHFVEQIERQQEQKYGNYDVTIDELMIEIVFGENWETFYFREDGTIRDTSGTYQGGRYEQWFFQIANELFNLMRSDEL